MTLNSEGALDLGACETEPLSHIGAIQAPFALAVFCAGRRTIKAVSANLPSLCGLRHADLEEMCVTRLFESWPDAFDRGAADGQRPVPVRLVNGTECVARPCRVGSDPAVLIDPAPDVRPPAEGLHRVLQISEMLDAALAAPSADIAVLSDGLVRAFRQISGYDRVMVYRFDPDWNGTIIAEAARDDLHTRFHGLTFPSSDIPRPARDLFLRNRVRHLVDAEAASVPLCVFGGGTPDMFDLGELPERAVSPVHLAYLENMGVRATLTVALIVGGSLWGLLTCHNHSGPLKLSGSTMDLCRVICDLVSHGLTRIEDRAKLDMQRDIDALALEMRTLARHCPLPVDEQAFYAGFAPRILEVLSAKAALLSIDGRVHVIGADAGDGGVALQERLRSRLRRSGARVIVTDHAVAYEPDLAAALLPACAGIAFVRHESDATSLMAIRPATPRVETWAGDPQKRVSSAGRLSPRASFERWQAETCDKCPPWPHDQATRLGPMLALLSEVGWTLARRRAEHAAQLARRKAEDAMTALAHSALHDPLTDLPNRSYLDRVLHGLASHAGGDGGRIAALYIDLDRFKAINDALGRAAGDLILQHVARTLHAEKRDSDFVARVGSDAFVLVASERSDPRSLAQLAGRILAELARPLGVADRMVTFGASIGIACGQREKAEPDALLVRAEIALAEAKRLGRGRFCFVSDEMAQARIERLRLGNEVRRAFEAREFELYFQMQFDSETRDVVGAEALLRWNHPMRGVLSPSYFLDAAEDIGVMDELDALAVEKALDARRRWAKAGLHVPKISVNVSARRLQNLDVAALVRAHPDMPEAIAFELLESMDLDGNDAILQWNIDRVRDAGIALEIDDFGTGHTSILSLVRLKPDRIKIDKNLVAPVVESPVAREVVGSIVRIARSLGIGVTAEGVETEAHALVLQDLGCDTLQGYALAVPLSIEGVLSKHTMPRVG